MLGYFLFLCALVYVDSSKLVSLGQYSKPVASICIAIPPPGESYQEDVSPKKATANLNDVHSKKTSEQETNGSKNSPKVSSKRIPVNDTWVLPTFDYTGRTRASLQYFVKVNGQTPLQYWAGETIIPNSMLTPGYHILTYEQVVMEDGKLSLRVWWDTEEMKFQTSSDREVNSKVYEPSHVVFFGPPSLQKSAQALCYDDRSPAQGLTVHRQTTLAVVATSVLLALMLLGVVAMVLVRRHCKADSLDIAGHSAPEKEAANNVAGLSGSNYEPSNNIAYQPVGSE